MVTYKEPFKMSFQKNLKQFFTEILNNTQPIIINIKAGTGWDWLELDNDNIFICINETEIAQCNIHGDSFLIYTDFGYGYCYFAIPIMYIECIFIGENISENYISSPVFVEKYNLPANVMKILLNEYELKKEENND